MSRSFACSLGRFGALVGLSLVAGACSDTAGGQQPAGGAGNAGMGQAGVGAVAGSSSTTAGGGVAGAPGAGQANGGATVAAGAGGATAGSGGTMAGNAGQGGMAPVLEPGIRWLGRVEKTATGARFSWPGTGFTARFDGTGAKLSLKTNQVDYFQLIVDGDVKLLTTQAGSHDYDLAQNLAAGEHTVTVWRRTESNAGIVEVSNVTFQGELLSPPPPSSKRLEVVGDSISVGFGNECKTIDEAFAYATENNYLSYEALTARKLGAELFTMAWSGVGMWRDVGGGTEVEMPEFYLRTIGNAGESRWDFSAYTPGAVLVLLGTNDFAKGDPGAPFVTTYQKFVTDVRGRYPLARIYLAHSPMLSGDRGTALAGYLEQVKSARAAAGDTNLGIVAFKPPAADGWGCGHPNTATHAVMAELLAQTLKQDLGW